jgi:hypothetical protein
MPGRVVEFAPLSNTICRPARDDERDVMQRFASHASHCPRCQDPYRVFIEGDTLCDRGHAYARDVAQYVYSKAGKPFSIIDRSTTDARVQIEIPAKCDVIRGLLKAVDHGLKIKSSALKPLISQDRTYPVSERRRVPRDDCDVTEFTPRRHEERRRAEGGHRRRESFYIPSGRGSLYAKDEEERRRRRREQGEPVIVYAEPRRSSSKIYRR